MKRATIEHYPYCPPRSHYAVLPIPPFLPLPAVPEHAGHPADRSRTARAGAALTQSHHPRTPMSTETADPRYTDIARWPTRSAVDAMIEGQLTAIAALQAGAQALADAADAAADRLRGGGRLCYAGAGTSGRVAVRDGVELSQTFAWGGGARGVQN